VKNISSDYACLRLLTLVSYCVTLDQSTSVKGLIITRSTEATGTQKHDSPSQQVRHALPEDLSMHSNPSDVVVGPSIPAKTRNFPIQPRTNTRVDDRQTDDVYADNRVNVEMLFTAHKLCDAALRANEFKHKIAKRQLTTRVIDRHNYDICRIAHVT
jgi:hypothetical protein